MAHIKMKSPTFAPIFNLFTGLHEVLQAVERDLRFSFSVF